MTHQSALLVLGNQLFPIEEVIARNGLRDHD